MKLKNMLDGDNDESLMEAIITGESELMSHYRDAMQNSDVDTELLKDLQSQYNKIEANLDLIQAKEEAA